MIVPGKIYKIRSALTVSVFTTGILTILWFHLENGILVIDRFFQGFGWIQILVAAIYSFVIAYHLMDIQKTALWRKYIWITFTIVFFLQFVLGLLIDGRFLMTGDIHLPVPMVILGGAIYRFEIGFMPILFISTMILTGPAWCSYLCYFGAVDNLAALAKGIRTKPIKPLWAYRYSMLLIVIIGAILLRITGCPSKIAGISAILFGIIGTGIMAVISTKRKKMVHCIAYCPIGILTSFLKYLSPFRIKIANTCTSCMACSLHCKYDALNLHNIKNRKPGITCTYCGDCLASCHVSSIHYTFLKLNPTNAYTLYISLVVVVQSVFLNIARI
jgi:polyferredoxin